MERGENSLEHKVLYGILATLCATALILGVIIIAKNLNNKSQTAETQDTTSTETQEFDAEYYQNLANEIISQDIDFTRGSEAIENAIKADELEKSIDSAGFVLNTASSYQMQEVLDEYSEILKTRLIEAGIDPEAEGEG